jgi:hypothetical protein
LGEKQLLRRFVEAELFSNCSEHFQPKILQLGHITIIDGKGPVAIVYSAAFGARTWAAAAPACGALVHSATTTGTGMSSGFEAAQRSASAMR